MLEISTDVRVVQLDLIDVLRLPDNECIVSHAICDARLLMLLEQMGEMRREPDNSIVLCVRCESWDPGEPTMVFVDLFCPLCRTQQFSHGVHMDARLLGLFRRAIGDAAIRETRGDKGQRIIVMNISHSRCQANVEAVRGAMEKSGEWTDET